MRTFIEEATKFETMQKGTAICILRSSDHGKDIEKEVEKFVQKAAASTVELGTLGRMIATEYPAFQVCQQCSGRADREQSRDRHPVKTGIDFSAFQKIKIG